jgi:hypothetical protein
MANSDNENLELSFIPKTWAIFSVSKIPKTATICHFFASEVENPASFRSNVIADYGTVSWSVPDDWRKQNLFRYSNLAMGVHSSIPLSRIP